MSATPVVAVVGAGASGTLAAAHLATTAAAAATPVEILLVDPDPPGRGLAYRTTDPRHRLNVPARNMSAWPDEPGDFLRWLRRHVAVDFPEGGYAPRLHYAQYLTGVLERAAAGPGVRLDHLPVRATDLRRHGSRLRLTLADGTSRPVDAAVLALGYDRPSTLWAPAGLERSDRFVADPWSTEPYVGRGDEVVVVGAGLTAADMAQRWGREGVRLHVVSRHGMLPLPHAAVPQPPAVADGPVPGSLAEARRLLFDRIRAAGGDWRRAVDGLRPVTSTWWAALDEPSRRAFLGTAARRWDRVRHRVDPAVHEWLEQRRSDGSLVVHAASVSGAVPGPGHLRVTLTDGSVIRAAAVLNCTGAGTSVSASADPLLMNLLATGLITPGPLDLGLATDSSGRVIPATGRPGIWALGPLRRGDLWESTAIPEIRVQAAALARDLVPALPHAPLQRRPRDPYGLPVSAGPAAAGRYVAALGRILRVRSGAESLVREAVAADPRFALGHAVLAVLGTEWGAEVDVEAALAAAHAPGTRADERERRFVEVATARVREPGPASAAALLSYIHSYPEDALAVSLAVPTIAFGGATEIPAEAWALVEGLAPAYGDDWWYLGLLAYTRQDQGRFAEAGELAGRALAIEPAAGHAVHAKAHAHYETGDHRAGLAWLDRWIAGCGAHASHRAHFSWHAALHELALGDDGAVADRYAAQLAPGQVTGVRALVDSASLLWRVRMAGGDPQHGVDEVLRVVPAGLLAEPPTPFVALHAALALAAVGDCQGLARLRRWARSVGTEVFTDTVAPLAGSLSDLVHSDADRAVDGLVALAGVDRLGGSAAQREIVQETLLHCAMQAGRTDLAAGILRERLDRRESVRDRRRLRALRTADTSS
ncbi:MAG TPA: FAD/NAD(P)-binding protein [Mycobacteriales bacterium]